MTSIAIWLESAGLEPSWSMMWLQAQSKRESYPR
jgi:hypothetical protein